jgi:hypothetical protein
MIAVGAGWLLMSGAQSRSASWRTAERYWPWSPDDDMSYRETSHLYRSPGARTDDEIYEIDDAPGSGSSVADSTGWRPARVNALVVAAGAIMIGAAFGLAMPEGGREIRGSHG